MAAHCMGIPGSKQEKLLFSFPSLLLSSYVETQHPMIKVMSLSQVLVQAISLRGNFFFFS